MLFTSPVFLFFFLPVAVAVYFAVPRRLRPVRNAWLLAASFFFYWSGEPRFTAVLAVSCLVNWAAALLAAPGRRFRHFFLALAIAANLALLAVYKYAVFATEQCNWIFGTAFRIPAIALPLGISFFTFQAMSYVLDVHAGKSPPRANPLDVALYVVLFPQLIAGPIVRYGTVEAEIRGRRENWRDFSAGLCRFAEGFAKKMLLANPLGIVADSAFDGADWILPATEGGGVFLAWLGAVAFALQIYFDFSGYSDMAIGLGRVFGFHFDENFLHPYASRSVSEFWRRWHVSMGTWFRDYVYFPLGGSRVRTRLRLVANLLAVWFLTGLWHGANWTFILWGLFYFVLIAAEKLSGVAKRVRGPLLSAFGWVATMSFVLFGWVLFRADSVSGALRYFGTMFGAHGAGFACPAALLLFRENALLLAGSALLSLPVAPALARWADSVCISRGAKAVRAAVRALWLVFLFLASLSFVAKGAHNPFLYFNF
jgi:alginate O-acetyltransferase complex protein AlgI